MNSVQMKLQQLADPVFNKITFSKTARIFDRNGIWQISGRVYRNGTYETVRKSTLKKSTPANKKWLEKNFESVLWEQCDYKKEIDEKLDQGKEKNKTLFSVFAQEVLNKQASTIDDEDYGVGKFTMKEYMHKYNKYISPFFEACFIEDIDIDIVDKWQQWVLQKKYQTGNEMNHRQSHKKTLGIKSLKNIRIVLNHIFKDAVLKKYIDRNPLDAVKVPTKSKKATKTVSFLTLDEIKIILDGLDGFIGNVNRAMDTRIRKQFKNIFLFMIGSGLRSGEVIGLQWSDLDFENQTVSVNRRIRDGDIDKPKTASSIRTITVLKEAIDALKEQKEISGSEKWVFTNRYYTEYTSPGQIDWMYKKVLKYVGLPEGRLYNLRHTFATNLIHNGRESITTVSGLLGHNDSIVTQKTYISNVVKSDSLKGKSIFG